jgi:predicted lipid-binding transport protein (Tim44 family)
MKKFLFGLIVLAVFAVTIPLSVNAQTCRTKRKSYSSKNYQVRGYQAQRPSFWNRHRNTRNILLSTGGGALVGGLLGGSRKSMAKGAIVGAGAGALYTFILKPKKRWN